MATKTKKSGKNRKPARRARAPSAKRTTAARAPKAHANGKRLSALDAAATVLLKSHQPMHCRELIEKMAAAKLWESPAGKTPAATLYSAIIREIAAKGKDSRFTKTDRGLFCSN